MGHPLTRASWWGQMVADGWRLTVCLPTAPKSDLADLPRRSRARAGPPVRIVGWRPRARCLDIRKAERTRYGPVAEQPLARANDDRKDPQAELIDEVVLQQRLDQVGAAGHVNFASGLSF